MWPITRSALTSPGTRLTSTTLCMRWVRRKLRHLGVIFFFQAEDGIRDLTVTGVQTCALPIFPPGLLALGGGTKFIQFNPTLSVSESRSEEHTSELQSQSNLVCRLLLEKK